MPQFKDPTGFSKLDVFRTCKQKFKFQFLDKLPQGSSPAMERGGRIHEGIEAYLNGWAKQLPAEVLAWKDKIDVLKGKNFKAEDSIGLDKSWKLLPNWFHKDTWLRAKMDARYKEGSTLVVVDFKTGKFRVPSTDQIELYAVVGHAIEPNVKHVVAQFWFTDGDMTHEQTYTAEELLELRKKYEGLFAPMYTEAAWNPEPSQECRWCPYSKTKGGPCRF